MGLDEEPNIVVQQRQNDVMRCKMFFLKKTWQRIQMETNNVENAVLED